MTKTRRIHNSKTPIHSLQSKKADENGMQSGVGKPTGLWYSIDMEWHDWCKSEGTPHWIGQYNYELTIDLSCILRLTTVDELRAFTAKFHKFEHREPHRAYEIDWGAVAKLYKGIEIAPYQWGARHSLGWYYTWDVASGCIWDVTSVKSIRRLG